MSLAVKPGGSIAEARAARQLNNGAVTLVFIGTATVALVYANVKVSRTGSQVATKLRIALDKRQ